MRKRLIGTIVAVLGAGMAVALLAPGMLSEEENTVAAQAQTVVIQQRTLTDSVGSTGAITAESVGELAFGVGGTVTEVLVETGDTVQAGDVLVRLDTTDFEYQIQIHEENLRVAQANLDELLAPPTAEEIARAENNVLNARAQLQAAELNELNAPLQLTQNCSTVATAQDALEDAQEAYDEYIREGYNFDATFNPDPDSAAAAALSDARTAYDNAAAMCEIATNNQEFDTSRQTAEAKLREAELALEALLAEPTTQERIKAEAQVTQAQISLDQARLALEDTVITAPFDGTVTAVKLLEGDRVSSDMPVITLMDMQQLVLDVSINELDVTRVVVGQPVEVAVQALDDAVLPGEVTFVSPVGDDSSGLVTYTVTVALLDPDVANTPVTPIPPGTGSGAFNNPDLATIMQALGGRTALRDILTTDDPAATLAERLQEADLSTEQQAALDALGGIDGLRQILTNLGDTNRPRTSTVIPDEPADDTGPAEPPAPANLEDPAVRVGMTADVEIIVNTLEDALVVPTSAIRYEGRTAYLLIETGEDEPQRVDITTGTSSSGFTVIAGDVEVGQTVIVPEVDPVATEIRGLGELGSGPFSGNFGGGFGNRGE